jgi:hypothetical protein
LGQQSCEDGWRLVTKEWCDGGKRRQLLNQGSWPGHEGVLVGKIAYLQTLTSFIALAGTWTTA